MATTEKKKVDTTYSLTKTQRAYLDSLVCQRISEDKTNKQIIRNFENPNSTDGILNALKKGWTSDEEDRMAYYIIKDPEDNQPLLFFSLKCGEIHSPITIDKLKKSLNDAAMVLRAAWLANFQVQFPYDPDPAEREMLQKYAMVALEIARNVEVQDWAKEVIEKQLVNGSLPDEAWDKIWNRMFRSMEKKDSYEKDVEEEGNNIIRTRKTFPSVELVHLCVHEPAREKWKAKGMASRSLGKTMFWYFIEKKIREIRRLVGCEYIYLFAADEERDGKLTQYYKELGFGFRDDINVTKPMYDLCCYFMCQEVTALWNRRNEFFRNYNEPQKPAAE